MKNLVFVLMMGFSAFLSAQNDHFMYKNALKLSLFEFGRDEIQLSYERFIGEERSSSFLVFPALIYQNQKEDSKKGFQLMTQYRFYVSQLRSDERSTILGFHNVGFYAGPYLQGLIYNEDYTYGYWSSKDNQYIESQFTKDVQSVEGGAIMGLQFDITPRILVDFFIGGGVKYSKVDDSFDLTTPDIYQEEYSIFDREYNGVKPKVGFQIGLTF